MTVGIPATGLFFTHQFRPGTNLPPKDAAMLAFVQGLQRCTESSAATPNDYAAALNQQGALGLSDDDLPQGTREAVEQIREMLRVKHGYRIVKRAHSNLPSPSVPARASWPPLALAMAILIAIYLVILIGARMALGV